MECFWFTFLSNFIGFLFLLNMIFIYLFIIELYSEFTSTSITMQRFSPGTFFGIADGVVL